MKCLLVLTALTGLLAAGCSSNRGGAYDQQQNPGYNTGTTENPNTQPYPSGGPERGPGTGGMGGTSTAPGGDNSGSGTSDSGPAPNYNDHNPPSPAPSAPDSGSQSPR